MVKLYTKNTWQDEILAGDERYNILADDGTPISSDVQIQLSTGVAQPGTALDASRMNNIEDGLDAVDTRLDKLERMDLNELTAAADGDLLPIVDDPAGTPETKKITVANLLAARHVVRYNTSAGQNIPNDTVTIVNFDNQVFDPLNLVTVGASWKFQATIPGYYAVTASVLFTASSGWSGTEYALMQIYKNGSVYSSPARVQPTTALVNAQLHASDLVYLNADDTLNIRVRHNNGSALPLDKGNTFNYVSIWKV